MGNSHVVDTLQTHWSLGVILVGLRVRGRTFGDRLEQISSQQLRFGQVVSDVSIDVIPVIANTVVTEPDRQGGHVSDEARLRIRPPHVVAEVTDLGNAPAPLPFISSASEFFHCRIVSGVAVF